MSNSNSSRTFSSNGKYVSHFYLSSIFNNNNDKSNNDNSNDFVSESRDNFTIVIIITFFSPSV